VNPIHISQHLYEGDHMHIEFRHLRTIKAIHDAGGLARAAELLNMTQSALSHQVKGLEEQAGVELFVRRAKPLRLSAAGLKMLRAAEDILPRVTALEEEFSGLQKGSNGRLHIAIECHACFDWLFPVLEQFRKAWPDVDVDIRPGLAFDALPALRREEVDLVISSDPEALEGVSFLPLFDYAPVFVAASAHPLAERDYVEAEDFRDQTLITYPVDRARLGRVHAIADARQGRTARRATGGTDGGYFVAGGIRARGRGAARLGAARGALSFRLRHQTHHRRRADAAVICCGAG
jgi:DNA-binding transcriptional LysR family regulator